MKKSFILLVALFGLAISVNAQIMRTEELEKYAKEKYGEKWIDAAANLGATLNLDKNKSLTYVQVIDCGSQTKNQLYVILNYWVSASFNDANSVIQLNDKDLGCIIAQGYLSDIAGHMGGVNSYDVRVRPVIKLDIKDGKVRVTYTVQNYDAVVLAGGGIMGAIGGTVPTKYIEKWMIDQCYPFVQKDKRKKTSSKALIMTHAFSNVIMDKIQEAVQNGVTGNENDNW